VLKGKKLMYKKKAKPYIKHGVAESENFIFLIDYTNWTVLVAIESGSSLNRKMAISIEILVAK